MNQPRYFKLLNENGETPQRGFRWPIPNGKPGDWLPPINGKLALCENAYHVLTAKQLVGWSDWAPVLLEVEIGKEHITDGEKTGVREARPLRLIEQWNDAVLRLFDADCAEHVIHLYEQVVPNDDRPRKAIQAARDFACGKIDDRALAAARDAAGAAARDAARAAAWDAAWAAAWAAARDAAWAAAGDAEQRWQEQRLRYYLGFHSG